MTFNKDKGIQIIIQSTGTQALNKNVQMTLEELRKVSATDGFDDKDLNALSDFLVNTKLSAQCRTILFGCLVPHKKIPNEIMKKILLWFFAERETMSVGVQKQFLQWLAGIAHYELTDINVIDSYYYSFLFLLRRPYLLGALCRILCIISKPECARRWVVQQILGVHIATGCRSHTSSVLNLLKSFKPEVVPEHIPLVKFSYETFGNYDVSLKKSHERMLTTMKELTKTEDLKWNTWQLFSSKKSLTRLIPPPEYLNFDGGHLKSKTTLSVLDSKTMQTLGINLLRTECPAQVLSLLANKAGFHFLAYSNESIKTRFSHTLYHTLCKVFLLEMYPYLEKEKIHFLRSIKAFEEYVHEAVPVVTTFLFNYLLVWDGESYQDEILGLLEWIEMRHKNDLQEYVFLPLRQIFISSGIHTKCMIIRTLGKLLMNWLVMDKREKNFFQSHWEDFNFVKAVAEISAFVGELIAYGLIANSEKNSRKILMASLDFYEVTQAVEQAGDLPIIIVMSPSVVYQCLFSGSRVCIARLCALLNRLQLHSVERLFQLGITGDFSEEIRQLHTYIFDYYRCLWRGVAFGKKESSFIFHDNKFNQMFLEFKQIFGNEMDKVFSVEYNSTFLIPHCLGLRENMIQELTRDYPSVVELKELMETQILKE